MPARRSSRPGRNFGTPEPDAGRNFDTPEPDAGRNFGAPEPEAGPQLGRAGARGRPQLRSPIHTGRNFGALEPDTGRNFGEVSPAGLSAARVLLSFSPFLLNRTWHPWRAVWGCWSSSFGPRLAIDSSAVVFCTFDPIRISWTLTN